MKWEENWSNGRKVEQEGKGEEARRMERRKEEGWDQWKSGREGKIGGIKGGKVRKRTRTGVVDGR